MIDPPRYLDGEDGRLERELLASALNDAGSGAAYRRVQAAIGAGIALGIGAEATTASAATVGKATATLPALVLKWSAIGALAGTVVAGTAAVVAVPVRHPASPNANTASAERRTSESASVHEAANAESASRRLPVTPDSPVAPIAPIAGENAAPRTQTTSRASSRRNVVERAQDDAPAPASQALNQPPAATAPIATNMLAEEIALVDAARASLARRDPSSALAQIAQHDREFPGGALALDVAVLQIRALLMAGRRPEAQMQAQRVLAANPTGAYATRVRELLTQTNP